MRQMHSVANRISLAAMADDLCHGARALIGGPVQGGWYQALAVACLSLVSVARHESFDPQHWRMDNRAVD